MPLTPAARRWSPRKDLRVSSLCHRDPQHFSSYPDPEAAQQKATAPITSFEQESFSPKPPSPRTCLHAVPASRRAREPAELVRVQPFRTPEVSRLQLRKTPHDCLVLLVVEQKRLPCPQLPARCRSLHVGRRHRPRRGPVAELLRTRSSLRSRTNCCSRSPTPLLPPLNGPAVFTTDSYVVSPRFFPGGDIGSLAVFGTANDLSVAGARPRFISLALILEEGFSRTELRRIVASIAAAARAAGVAVATGDTKVVTRGACDGLFINTSGIGELFLTMPGPRQLSPGDEIVVSGPIARHGMAVLAAREQLGFDPPLESDCAPLFPAVAALGQSGVPVRALRDATRGGVAAVLHEWAAACGHSFVVDEAALPLTEGVRGACELLGLDPLHVACEGTIVAALPSGYSEESVRALQQARVSAGAARIGVVVPATLAPVLVRRALRQPVPLDEPAGAPLPRIC